MLPTTAARDGYSLAQSRELAARANLLEIPQGADASLYWSGHVSHFMPTALVPRRAEYRALAERLDERVGVVSAATPHGEMTLDAFLADPHGRVQGLVVVHGGKVVYESYPGMREADPHFWASNAKPMASLLIDLLIDEGQLDERAPFGDCVPEFRGTAWADVSVRDLLDMTPGLDTEENDQSRGDPTSLAMRAFFAEFNVPDPATGKVARLADVLKTAQRVRAPGGQFEYGSPVTQALVYLTEAVGGRTWADQFDDKVWSAVGADGDLQIHLSPDRVALVHGLVSSRLRDMARFGMLYTPSWTHTASRQVVSPGIIQRIRNGVRSHEFFMRGYDGPVFTERLGAPVICNSRQWDAVFEDGDFFKCGFLGQCLYVSPDRDLVIAGFSTNVDNGMGLFRFLRPLAAGGLFD